MRYLFNYLKINCIHHHFMIAERKKPITQQHDSLTNIWLYCFDVSLIGLRFIHKARGAEKRIEQTYAKGIRSTKIILLSRL